MTLNEIKPRLPTEAKAWLDGMNREELQCTEIILNNVGEDQFLKNWPAYRQDLKEVRNF